MKLLSDTSVVAVTAHRCVASLHFQPVYKFQTLICQAGLERRCWGWGVQKLFYCTHVKLTSWLRHLRGQSRFVWSASRGGGWAAGWQFHHLVLALHVARYKSKAPGYQLSPLCAAGWEAEPCCLTCLTGDELSRQNTLPPDNRTSWDLLHIAAGEPSWRLTAVLLPLDQTDRVRTCASLVHLQRTDNERFVAEQLCH